MRVTRVLVVLLAAAGAAGAARAAAAAADVPRVPLPKAPAALAGPADLLPGLRVAEYQLAVKFVDAARVRPVAGGSLRSEAGADLSRVRAVQAALGLRFAPHIALPEPVLADLERRAEARSGLAQPDLAGLLRVERPGAGAQLLADAGNALLALPEVEFVSLQALGAPPPGDIAPPTPDLVGLQAYHGPAPGMNSDAAHALGFDGAGRRLSDCEYGWVASHEDLVDIDLHAEPGQTVHPNVATFGWDEHGTAVLGEASCSVNAYGCSGMAAGAAVHTYPEWTLQEGFRIATCIAHAVAGSAPGDVVLLEMQTAAGGPVETDPAIWLLVRTATDAGVVVVAAAGNGNQNLDGPAYQAWRLLGDSGAILVGAGSASVAHDKLGFSSYGTRVNVQGWGEAVASLGYGDLAAYGGDKNQRYTGTFSGTSSASPFVASACLLVQQVAEVQRGEPLDPGALRQLLVDTGVPQGAGGHVGPFVDCGRAINVLLPWKDLGFGLAGANGTPQLDGLGSLQAAAPAAISLHGAPPLSLSVLFVGVSAIHAPFKGGVLVPAPDIAFAGLVTDLAGTTTVTAVTPPGLPPGLVVYLQQWILDPTAPKGVAASTALSGSVPQ